MELVSLVNENKVL